MKNEGSSKRRDGEEKEKEGEEVGIRKEMMKGTCESGRRKEV